MGVLKDLGLVLRPPIPDDDPYVLSGMVRTITGIGSGSPPPSYRDLPRRQLSAIERELRRRWRDPSYTRLVATPLDDGDMIAAFIVGRPSLLTYVAVRAGFQGVGLATEMLDLIGIDRSRPAAVEFSTWDLERPEPGRSFPAGLLRTGRWPHLQLVHWTKD